MKCHYCQQDATKGVIWADGRARIPVCEQHLDRAIDTVENRNRDSVSEIQTLEAHALTIAKVILEAKKKSRQKRKAIRKEQRRDAQKMDPDKYKKKWGRCPKGYHTEDDKCVKTEDVVGPAERQKEREQEGDDEKELVETPPIKGEDPVELGPEEFDEVVEPEPESPVEEPAPEPAPEPAEEPAPEPAPEKPAKPKAPPEPKPGKPEKSPALKAKDKKAQQKKQAELKQRLEQKREEREKSLAPPEEEKPKEPKDPREEAKQRRLKKAEEQRRAALSPQERKTEDLIKMATDDPKKYQKVVKHMRKTGELPDPKTARMMISVENPDDIPDEIKKDPAKLKKFVRQHVQQRQHEERVRDLQIKHLDRQVEERINAVEEGKVPKDIPFLKFIADTENQFGRPIPNKEKNAQGLQQTWDKFKDAQKNNEPEPNRWLYKLKKWAATLLRPIPKFRSRSTAMTIARVQAVLDDVAQTLERRNAAALAAEVDVVVAKIVEDDRISRTIVLLDATAEYLESTGNRHLADKLDRLASPLAGRSKD